MQAGERTTKAIGELVRGVGERCRHAGDRLVTQAKLVVDLDRLQRASSWADRLAAVSWPRAGVFIGAPLTLSLGLYAFALLTSSHAFPPPDPTAREIAARSKALAEAPHKPPASLIEANKSMETR